MKLSKRELILLILLLIIGLSFMEYRFVLTPGLARFTELTAKEAALDNEINTINFDLTVAKTMQKTLDENLLKIGTLSKPFLSSVSPDALLVFTHQMLTKHGFIVSNYSPSPVISSILLPETAEISNLTYRIKQIAQEYQAAEQGVPMPTEPTSTEEPPAEAEKPADTVVELYTLMVNASGTYDQIKAMMDDFKSLDRKILIKNINMSPSQSVAGILDIEFWIEYYGIEKLEPADDPLNEWSRETLPASTEDPYADGTETTETTETTTTETTA